MPKWVQLPSGEHAPVGRSSHTINAIGNKLYVFGGENKPREPVDNVLYVYDLSARSWLPPIAAENAPQARVGHTAAVAGGKLYIFGGRTGIDTGVGTGKGETALGDLWAFDPAKGAWAQVGEAGAPPIRSYHAMASTLDAVYVFGGCGEGGRIADLWEFNPATDTWAQLPTSEHIKGRGGAGLVAAADGSALFVVCGFCGEEISDVHRYDIAKKAWDCPAYCSEDTAAALPPRSVFGIGSHACGGACSHGGHVLLFGGEVDPSTQGHEGAGAFSSDVFCLDTSKGTGGPAAWHKLSPSGDAPRPRGWFAAAAVEQGMVVHGGNNADNERMGDLWLLAAHED